MEYRHTQIGYLMIIVSLSVVLLYAFLYKTISAEANSAIIFVTIIMAFAVLILASFSTLQVTVDEQYMRIRFGYGLVRKEFAVGEIVSAESVKNHWYYGWGVRVWFWPYMQIYNVSGFDAVEIVMKDGKRYRIGTDTPQELENFLNDKINRRTDWKIGSSF